MKGKFMKRVLFGVFTFLFIYTIFHSYMFYKIGTEPSMLHTMVFGACSVEVILSMIKKIKEADRDANSNKSNTNIWADEYSSPVSEHSSRVNKERLPSRQYPHKHSSSSDKPDIY